MGVVMVALQGLVAFFKDSGDSLWIWIKGVLLVESILEWVVIIVLFMKLLISNVGYTSRYFSGCQI